MNNKLAVCDKISEFLEKVSDSDVPPVTVSVRTRWRFRKMRLFQLYSAAQNAARVSVDIGKQRITPTDYYVSQDGKYVVAIIENIRMQRFSDLKKSLPKLRFKKRSFYVKTDDYYQLGEDCFIDAMLRSWQLIADRHDVRFGNSDAVTIGTRLIDDAAEEKRYSKLSMKDVRTVPPVFRMPESKDGKQIHDDIDDIDCDEVVRIAREIINMKTIYLAGGCFWGTQKFFDQFDGVKETEVGYANGPDDAPTYEDVCRSSGHAETVKIVFDKSIISLEELLKYYFMVIDPVSVNRQGHDAGIQYRTGIYYTDPLMLEDIRKIYDEEERKAGVPLAVEVKPLRNFFPAEEYHQKYLDKNPGGYCHIPAPYLNMSEEKGVTV